MNYVKRLIYDNNIVTDMSFYLQIYSNLKLAVVLKTHHIESIQTPDGVRVKSRWTLRIFLILIHMESIHTPDGVQVESRWSPGRVQVDIENMSHTYPDSTRTPPRLHGVHTESRWTRGGL